MAGHGLFNPLPRHFYLWQHPAKGSDHMDANQTPNDLIDENELCDWLRITTHTTRKWRLLGKGPKFHRLGGHLVRYSRAEVQAWLDANTYTSTTRRVDLAAA